MAAPGFDLSDHAADITAAVRTWQAREAGNASADQILTAREAVREIDCTLAHLHGLRSRLVTELRRDEDIAAARVDAMLAAYRAAQCGTISPAGDLACTFQAPHTAIGHSWEVQA